MKIFKKATISVEKYGFLLFAFEKCNQVFFDNILHVGLSSSDKTINRCVLVKNLKRGMLMLNIGSYIHIKTLFYAKPH